MLCTSAKNTIVDECERWKQNVAHDNENATSINDCELEWNIKAIKTTTTKYWAIQTAFVTLPIYHACFKKKVFTYSHHSVQHPNIWCREWIPTNALPIYRFIVASAYRCVLVTAHPFRDQSIQVNVDGIIWTVSELIGHRIHGKNEKTNTKVKKKTGNYAT